MDKCINDPYHRIERNILKTLQQENKNILYITNNKNTNPKLFVNTHIKSKKSLVKFFQDFYDKKNSSIVSITLNMLICKNLLDCFLLNKNLVEIESNIQKTTTYNNITLSSLKKQYHLSILYLNWDAIVIDCERELQNYPYNKIPEILEGKDIYVINFDYLPNQVIPSRMIPDVSKLETINYKLSDQEKCYNQFGNKFATPNYLFDYNYPFQILNREFMEIPTKELPTREYIYSQQELLLNQKPKECNVCLEKKEHYCFSLLECGHMLCMTCAFEIRNVMKNYDCPFCKKKAYNKPYVLPYTVPYNEQYVMSSELFNKDNLSTSLFEYYHFIISKLNIKPNDLVKKKVKLITFL